MKFKELYKEPSRNGLTKPSAIRGTGIKFCNMGELFANSRIGDIPMELVPVTDREMADALLEEGDLLFARQSLVREGAGQCSVVTTVKEPTTFDSHLIRVRLNQEVANPLFYHYYFSSYLSPIPKIVTQCAQSGIRGKDLAEIDVLYLPIDVQNEIAGTLSRFDLLIENNRKQIKLLEEAAQRLYKEWFIDLHFPGHEDTEIDPETGLPKGWRSELLIENATVQYGYSFNAAFFNSTGAGTPIVRIRNVQDGFSNDFTTEEFPSKYHVSNGDLLVGMDGEFYINTWVGDDAALVQRSCRIRPRSSINEGYLKYALKPQLIALQNGIVGATVAHLGKKHIDAMQITIPDDSLMEVFAQIEKRSSLLRHMCRMASEARDRLLPKLIEGEVGL